MQLPEDYARGAEAVLALKFDPIPRPLADRSARQPVDKETVGVRSNGNFCSVRNVETHEHLFVAFAFHTRSVGSAVSVAFRPDGDNDDGISPYNEALAAHSNSPSRV